jgi:hypothetical protein
MTEPNLFEEMLATYPAEKRELAREVYHRFADGDSAQFFTQLFLVLDVYARYVEHIPRPRFRRTGIHLPSWKIAGRKSP